MMKSWHLRDDVPTSCRDTLAATRRHNSGRALPYFTGGQTPEVAATNPTTPPPSRQRQRRSSELPGSRCCHVRFVALLWQHLYLVLLAVSAQSFGASRWYGHTFQDDLLSFQSQAKIVCLKCESAQKPKCKCRAPVCQRSQLDSSTKLDRRAGLKRSQHLRIKLYFIQLAWADFLKVTLWHLSREEKLLFLLLLLFPQVFTVGGCFNPSRWAVNAPTCWAVAAHKDTLQMK